MKKIFTMAMLVCLSCVCAMAQFRAEIGYAYDETKSDFADYSADGVMFGAYYAVNDIVFDNVFVESGLAFSSRSCLDGVTEYKKTDLALPISLGYAFASKRAFSVRPYAGVRFKYNLSYKVDDIDILDSDLMGTDVHKLQFGLTLGCMFKIKQHITVGYNTNLDFNKLYSDIKHKCFVHALSVGYSF